VGEAEELPATDVGGLPAELAHLSWLLGTWSGLGLGQYPTIDDFRFSQEVTFRTDGRPFIGYTSRSWILDDEGQRIRPAGTETGFLRALPDNEVELLLTHPTGFAEMWFGRVTVTEIEQARIVGARMEIQTDGIMRSPKAKEVNAGHRLYGLVNNELLWTYDMAAVGQPLTNHLSARLVPGHLSAGA
jgi:hypothetical protein